VPRHKIPNVGFAKIDQRGITRLFLPALYRENEVVPPTAEQLAALYNEAIRPSAIKVMPNAAGHWPPSYSAETIRISKHTGGYSFGTLDVPASKVRKFGSEVIEAVRALSFGQGAFFGHTLRGTKGRTTHDPDDQEEYMDVLADYLNILSLNHIKKEDWHVDVALEYLKLPLLAARLSIGSLPVTNFKNGDRLLTNTCTTFVSPPTGPVLLILKHCWPREPTSEPSCIPENPACWCEGEPDNVSHWREDHC